MPPARLALIADGFTAPERAERVVAAVRAGVRWVHLRDHQARRDDFARAAETLVERLRAVDASVACSVNTLVEVARALDTGVHVGRRGPSVEAARNRLAPGTLVGYSAHDLLDTQSDRTQAPDYFFFSPVFPTSSKPHHPGTGTVVLETFCDMARPTPTLALGGITPERVPRCRSAGAYGVAVLSGIMDADAPAAAARAYLRALAAPA